MPQYIFIGIEPNDAAHPAQKPHIFFAQNDSSSGHDDACQSALQSFEQCSFGIAKCRLAVARENIRDRNAELLPNHFVDELQLGSLDEPGTSLERRLHSAVPSGRTKFTALHAAFWSGGTFIYVPRNVEVELPVQSVLYADAPGLGIFGHTLIVVEENARLTYVEEYSSPRTGQAGFSSGVSELFLARGAQSEAHILFSRYPRRDRRRSKIVVSGIGVRPFPIPRSPCRCTASAWPSPAPR